jgi:hypothetical protein
MLSLNSLADVAPARARSLTGTPLACGATPVPCGQVDQIAGLPRASSASPLFAARPRGRSASSYLFDTATQAAGQAELARQQHASNVKYAHMTRIATKGGGSLGPHPARDPV